MSAPPPQPAARPHGRGVRDLALTLTVSVGFAAGVVATWLSHTDLAAVPGGSGPTLAVLAVSVSLVATLRPRTSRTARVHAAALIVYAAAVAGLTIAVMWTNPLAVVELVTGGLVTATAALVAIGSTLRLRTLTPARSAQRAGRPEQHTTRSTDPD